MEVTTHEKIVPLIKESLKKAHTYSEYRKMVESLVAEGKSTGPEQGEDQVKYSALNNSRMRRWDKTLKLSSEIKETLQQKATAVHWLVLTESWCGDAAHIIPVINIVAEQAPGVHLEILLRDENEALMDQFLTKGGRAIPKLIAFDPETKEVKYSWGPRPEKAVRIVESHRDTNGKLDLVFKEELQKWYNTDKGQHIAEELLAIME